MSVDLPLEHDMLCENLGASRCLLVTWFISDETATLVQCRKRTGFWAGRRILAMEWGGPQALHIGIERSRGNEQTRCITHSSCRSSIARCDLIISQQGSWSPDAHERERLCYVGSTVQLLWYFGVIKWNCLVINRMRAMVEKNSIQIISITET